MKSLFQEYGFLLVAIIVTTAFFGVFQHVLYSDNGIRFIYNDHMIYDELKYGDLSTIGGADDMLGIVDTYTGVCIPHFTVSPTKDFVFGRGLPELQDTVVFTPAMAMDGVQAFVERPDGTKDDLTSNITMSVFVYTPVYVNGTIQMEEVTATDKFGYPIYNADGTLATTLQPKYTQSFVSADDFISSGVTVNRDEAVKLKVMYRVISDTMKSEYVAIFTNQVRTQTTSDLIQDVWDNMFGGTTP